METHVFHSAVIEVAAGVTVKLNSESNADNVVFSADVGNVQPKGERIVDVTENDVIITWDNALILTVAHTALQDGHRYDVRWEVKNRSVSTLRDTISLSPGHWYGACQIARQLWPLEKWKRGLSAYVTGDAFEDEYGGVQERYFLCSSGVGIFVEEDIPLYVAINKDGDQKLTFVSKWSSPYRNVSNSALSLAYSIFQGKDVKHTHQLVSSQVFSKPTNTPDEKVFRYPIWSTWAQFKKNISQAAVLSFAKEIKDRGFPASQIEIDDDWTPYYGDMTFDPRKFPDAKKMIEEIHENGSRVTLWVHPFSSPMSSAAGRPYWLKAGVLPGYYFWWNGVGKYLDVTNPDAVAWYQANLEALKGDLGVDSFKFDAGEMNWFPPMARSMEPLVNPSAYSTKYARMCADIDKDLRIQEVRVGFRTQDLPVMVRMMDKQSRWGEDKGLCTLIPHALTFGIIGYPFVLPDMIGGNAYDATGWPDRELYIRWLQASTFLPVLQFSVVPWHYDDEVVDITRTMVALHEEYADLILRLSREAVETGAPIVRPLWWIAPQDEDALVVDSEFLVGNELLVAPVLQQGARQRDLYLPAGQWRDMLRGDIKQGGWHRNYAAELHELPYFRKISDSECLEKDTDTFEQNPSSAKVTAPCDLDLEQTSKVMAPEIDDHSQDVTPTEPSGVQIDLTVASPVEDNSD